jgi:solute carrier family 25 uncoupling protein 8/9
VLGAESRDSSAIASKVAAGMLSGALAAGISNPTDLVKTQMQKGGGAQGGPFAVLARVVRAEGVRGLWVGTTPSMVRQCDRALRWFCAARRPLQPGQLLACLEPCSAGWPSFPRGSPGRLQARAALLTAAQCATYDELKLFFVRSLGWEDNLQTHFTGGQAPAQHMRRKPLLDWGWLPCRGRSHRSNAACAAVSGLAGLVTTTVTAPVDMIKTNMFVRPDLYPTPTQCLRLIVAQQGVRGLFKGWGAQWARQGPMTTAIFCISEWLRGAFGMDSI